MLIRKLKKIIGKYLIKKGLSYSSSELLFAGGVNVSSHHIFIGKDCEFYNTPNIHIGKQVYIGDRSNIKALTEYDTINGKQLFNAKIFIGNNVRVTEELQIHALNNITIEDDVLIAKNVFMCDGVHGYDRVDTPFMYQALNNIKPIKIETGAWIGQNVVIMPGVVIGKFSIIGANSVVTQSISEYSIAVGAPAKVIKKWNTESNQWESIKLK